MKTFIALLALLGSLPLAAASIPPEQALELCRAEQNALRRLTCYDAIATDGSTVQSRPADTTPTQATLTEPAPQQFGLEHRPQEDMAEQLNVVVKSLQYSPRKELIVEFTNGQIWQQIGSEYYHIAEGEAHVIRRGVLSSFLLGNDKNNRTIRVKRKQ